MMRARKNIRLLMQGLMSGAFAVLISPLLPLQSGTNTAWAQDAAPSQSMFAQQPAHVTPPQKRKRPTPPAPTAGTAGSDVVSYSSSSPLGVALAACDKQYGRPQGLSLPGSKGDVKLDRCYPGRDHFVCTIRALSAEAKTLVDDYTKIVDANYPNVDNVESVCSIEPDALTSDLQKSSSFAPRFRDLKNAYESLVGCATMVQAQMKDVNLSDMAQAADILKSMNEALQDDMKDVATTRQQVFDLAQRMDASQKAISVIQRIHMTMCVASGQDAQAAGDTTGGDAAQ